ncbi:hypothetical protein EV645_7591 [Kribbella rubisoli]|uniref:Sensor domain-containing protein n=2 Tax=Kribbella rubisoli TaxID=3075929 RepID=A0A4Q7W4G3_9ACTN|nr:hypothetical protein EV645_7591 [Kribbella rubisoli]
MRKNVVRGVVVMVSLAAVAACGGPKKDTADPSPVVVTTSTPSPPPLDATGAAAALATGGLGFRDVPGMQPLGAPITTLTSPTIAALCGTTAAGLTSEKLRMARRQLVWTAGPSEFVSEERIVYRQGGVQAAMKDLLTSSTICPDRIGVRPVPSSAKLPAGSMEVSSHGTGQGGDSYAVPVGNRLLVVLWSNWTGSSSEPTTIRTALAKARTVVVQREQPTLRALAG